MDAGLKEQWIAALRGGEFKQATGALKRATSDGSKFCCLGVLCVIAGEQISDDFGERDENYAWVRKQISNLETGTLQSLNDRGKSFAEIADYIEANL